MTSTKYHLKYERQENFIIYFRKLCNAVYKLNTIEKWTKGWILSSPEKSESQRTTEAYLLLL